VRVFGSLLDCPSQQQWYDVTSEHACRDTSEQVHLFYGLFTHKSEQLHLFYGLCTHKSEQVHLFYGLFTHNSEQVHIFYGLFTHVASS
jgi:hypothetical protein